MRLLSRAFLTAWFIVLSCLILSVSVVTAQSYGSNWTGSYFNNTTWSGTPVQIRIDAQINFNFGLNSPITGVVNVDNFSVAWVGVQNFEAGTYRFTAVADDGVRVRIDGQEIINGLTPTGSVQTLTADVSLSAGAHTINVDYFENTGPAIIQFYWTPIQAGPTTTPAPTATPSPTPLPEIPPGALRATVIRASVLNIRNAPSLGGSVMGRVLRGQTYAVVGRNEDATWFLLQLGGYRGWAWGYYLFIDGNEFSAPVVSSLSVVGLPAGVTDTGVLGVTKAALRLRAEPNVRSDQIGRVSWGSFVPIVGRTRASDWYQIVWKGTVGWVVSGYVDLRQGELRDVPVR